MSTNNTEKEFKLSSWAIENKMTIYVTMIMFLFLGLSAYYNMPREDFPEIKETKIYISTVYPGNTAEDIERLIVDPLEEELRNVSNVVKVLSTSQEDYGIITVEFDEKITVDAAKQKIKDKIDTKTSGEDWPTFNGAKVEPNVFDLNMSEEVPIVNINIKGDYPVEKLKLFGEYLEDEIEALDENTDLESLKNKFFETGFSKLLIYRDSIDNIIGYTHSFELFKKPINLKSILLPIPVIPESMPANEILEFFTKQKKSVAVVVDEFGGTSGMVTIEDVIEELFGDIEDEHDSEDLVEKVVSENEFIFSARLEIDYINEQYKLNLPESDEYETLAGYIIYLHESIPEKGNTIETAEFSFFITEVSTHKIEIVKVTKI